MTLGLYHRVSRIEGSKTSLAANLRSPVVLEIQTRTGVNYRPRRRIQSITLGRERPSARFAGSDDTELGVARRSPRKSALKPDYEVVHVGCLAVFLCPQSVSVTQRELSDKNPSRRLTTGQLLFEAGQSEKKGAKRVFTKAQYTLSSLSSM
jgi:hypothetical protein